MADRAFQDGLDNIRGIPERIFLVVCAGIVHIPVACPPLVVGRTWHFRMGEPSRAPVAAFKKQVADRGPSYGESVVFEDSQKVRNVLPLTPSPFSYCLWQKHTKSPTQLEIR